MKRKDNYIKDNSNYNKKQKFDSYNRNSNYNNRHDERERSPNYSTFSHASNSNVSNNSSSSMEDPYSKITKSIWNYYANNAQSTECFQKKMELVEALKHMFMDIFPYLGVYIVGSSANGFGTNQSDVDICLMISHEELNQKYEAVLVLRALAKAMRRSSFIRNLNVIAAKVPIIKFHDNHNKIDCDINLNNHIGIRNTHLLKAYSEIDWRVRPLVLAIKRWADYQDINDASQRTISSYSFALMTIYYLQSVCQPAVLPVLQKLDKEKFNAKTDIRSLRLNESSYSWTSKNIQTLGELFMGFIDYYSDFNFEDNVISIRLGELIPRDCLSREEQDATRSSSYMKIEEPFDLSNTARSVYEIYTFKEIRNIFKRTNLMLKSKKDYESVVRQKFGDFGSNSNYDRW